MRTFRNTCLAQISCQTPHSLHSLWTSQPADLQHETEQINDHSTFLHQLHHCRLQTNLMNDCFHMSSVGVHGPSWPTLTQHVLNLAMWEKFPEGDKGPVDYPPRYKDCLTQGRFKKAKSAHAPTDITVWLESMKRYMILHRSVKRLC